MSQGLVIPVLPFALVEVAHVDEYTLQQWTSILLGAFGAGLLIGAPVAGYCADQSSSRRWTYLAGLLVLTASTITLSIGRTTTVLVIGRFIQSLASANVNAVGMAILTDVAGKGGVGPAMGVPGMSVALGGTLSPICGGFLYHHFGYLAVFKSAYVLITADFTLRLLMKEPKQDDREPSNADQRARICLPQTDDDSQRHIRSTQHPGYGASSEAESGVSKLLQRSHDDLESLHQNRSASSHSSEHDCLRSQRHPLLVLLSRPRLDTAILGAFMQSLVLTGLEAVFPLRIKTVFGYTSKGVSVLFLALVLPSFIAPVIGIISDRTGARTVVSMGFFGLLPLLTLLGAIDHPGTGQLEALWVALLFTSICLTSIQTPIFSEVAYVVDECQPADPSGITRKRPAAQAFALLGMAYAGGSLVGPLLAGPVSEKVGWQIMITGIGIVSSVCGIPCLLFLKGGATD